MARTKKEIEEWLKVFSKQQEERIENDEEWNYELYVPEAILDLLPEWERETWREVDWMMDDEGIGIFEDAMLEEGLEEYGVESIDDLNEIYWKRFYDITGDESDWWLSLEKEIQGKTGLPFEEIVIESGDYD